MQRYVEPDHQPKLTPKAIPPSRDRHQSAWLVGILTVLLVPSLGLGIFNVVGMSGPPAWFVWSLAVSAAFATLVWTLRAATAPAAALGGAICLKALLKQADSLPWTRTALPELIALFLLTFAATRFARRRAPADPREHRHGRNAAQILANLGFASLLLALPDTQLFLVALAALAEATADTVSSEMGQALRGRTLMLTSLRPAPPGTDGAISLSGTAFGLAAAALLAALPVVLHTVDWSAGCLIFLAATAGLFFDSLLGATLERRGWIGNDLVNFASTAFAGLVAYHAVAFFLPPMPYW